MKWSILILTQDSREAYLNRLLTVLGPQVARVHEQVELLVRTFDEKLTLGENRQLLVDDAKGDYINFVDDDDLVPFDYVSRILPKLSGKYDMVGFRVELWEDGRRTLPAIHSLKFGRWFEDKVARYRDISHLNPIKAELMRQVRFEGGRSEDHRWATGMRALGIVKTEYFLDDIMYLYLYRSGKKDGV